MYFPKPQIKYEISKMEFGLTVPVGYRANVYMSEIQYQIMHTQVGNVDCMPNPSSVVGLVGFGIHPSRAVHDFVYYFRHRYSSCNRLER